MTVGLRTVAVDLSVHVKGNISQRKPSCIQRTDSTFVLSLIFKQSYKSGRRHPESKTFSQMKHVDVHTQQRKMC